ncbi:MAG: hypothetical protein K8I27_10840 [Planctomycetes bacterium]|nr:hypothetical protein [Planctomycetota bacterium]
MPEEQARYGIIRLRIRDVTQLFNSLDPDPFIERDLDDDAVDYITSWAREVPQKTPLKLVVDITDPKQLLDHHEVIAGAIRNYFGQMMMLAGNEFRQLMKRGRLSLVIGLTVLAIAVALSNIIAFYTQSAFARMIEETVLIGGWVAMWRPMEIFLYDWWPVRRKRKDFERLRDMEVEVKLPTAAA